MSISIINSRTFLYGFFGLAILAFPTLGLSSENQTPQSIPSVKLVTAEAAKSMMDGGVPIVDTRVANEYVEQHIKNAISVPYKEKSAKSVNFDARLDSFDLTKLPADKYKAVIFYCNGGECWKSYKSCVAAVKAGYQNVYWLRGGIPEWKAKGLPVE